MTKSTSPSIFRFSSGETICALKQSIANSTISSSSSGGTLDTPQAVEINPAQFYNIFLLPFECKKGQLSNLEYPISRFAD